MIRNRPNCHFFFQSHKFCTAFQNSLRILWDATFLSCDVIFTLKHADFETIKISSQSLEQSYFLERTVIKSASSVNTHYTAADYENEFSMLDF